MAEQPASSGHSSKPPMLAIHHRLIRNGGPPAGFHNLLQLGKAEVNPIEEGVSALSLCLLDISVIVIAEQIASLRQVGVGGRVPVVLQNDLFRSSGRVAGEVKQRLEIIGSLRDHGNTNDPVDALLPILTNSDVSKFLD